MVAADGDIFCSVKRFYGSLGAGRGNDSLRGGGRPKSLAFRHPKG